METSIFLSGKVTNKNQYSPSITSFRLELTLNACFGFVSFQL